jgi:hypothetical protein
MNIYKLKYTDKETAINDFLQKGIYIEQTFDEDTNLVYGQGIHAVVEIGLIELVDGFHYDIMSENIIDFGENEIIVNNPKHNFWGYN